MTDCQRVANDLLRRTRLGVSAQLYNRGFALRSRISDLRGKYAYLLPDHEIITTLHKNAHNSGKHAIYHAVAK